MGLAKPVETCGLPCTGPQLAQKRQWYGFFNGSRTEPTRFYHLNPDCSQVTRTCCEQYI